MVNKKITHLQNEKKLLFAVAKGDKRAFEDIFHHYKDHIYTVAFTYTEDNFVTEEIVQDVFLLVWKNRQKIPTIENFQAWIYTIARNRSLTELQKIAREGKRKEALISYLPSATIDGETKMRENDLQVLLEKALLQLSPQQRKIFSLSRLQGHSRAEVAQMLNLAPATVSVHLTIAIRLVRAFLASHLELCLPLFFIFSDFFIQD